ncbi:MAG: MFS transporter [Bacillota bacterium]|nr:MFS transporter [Bacillota bacterium]
MKRNATLFLISGAMASVAMGAFMTTQGLYIMCLGYGEELLGLILSGRMVAGALGALPAGMISDRYGRKPVILVTTLLVATGWLGQAVFPHPTAMFLFSCLVGLAGTAQWVVGAPLLADNTSAGNRHMFFGLQFALMTAGMMVGNLAGGALPDLLLGRPGTWIWMEPASRGLPAGPDLGRAAAFRVSLVVFSLLTLASITPALMITEARPVSASSRAPLADLVGLAGRGEVRGLITYSVLIGFGAGLVVPFFNVFLSEKLGASPTVVGLILSLSNGATAVAGLLAPALVPRLGRVRTVVFTQVASIPFLLMIAVPPWLWLVGTAMFFRSALMNMSSPVAASFSMEIMEPHLRGTTSSLMRIADSLARALSSVCAGWIMARWGYDLPYVLTAALYMAASLIYYRQFQHFDAGRPGTHPSVRRPPG